MIYLFPSSHTPLQPTSITPVDLYPHRQTLMTLFQISCIHRFFWQNGSSMRMSAKTRGGGRRLCDARTPVHRWLVGVETRSQAHNSQCCARPVIFAGFFAASVYAKIYSYCVSRTELFQLNLIYWLIYCNFNKQSSFLVDLEAPRLKMLEGQRNKEQLLLHESSV